MIPFVGSGPEPILVRPSRSITPLPVIMTLAPTCVMSIVAPAGTSACACPPTTKGTEKAASAAQVINQFFMAETLLDDERSRATACPPGTPTLTPLRNSPSDFRWCQSHLCSAKAHYVIVFETVLRLELRRSVWQRQPQPSVRIPRLAAARKPSRPPPPYRRSA